MTVAAGTARAAAPTTHLLYLHGFRSSPLSTKAQKTAAWMAAHAPGIIWHCPALPASPQQAIDELEAVFSRWPAATRAVIGSSLGGFYATVIAERHGCRAVLLNPAVAPARDLASQVGVHAEWHTGDAVEFRAEFIDELRRLTPASISDPSRYFAVIAKGDEVLDWREMQARYAGSRIKLLEGGDHGLSDFDDHLADIAVFLALGGASPGAA